MKHLNYFENFNIERFTPHDIEDIVAKYLDTALWLAPDDESGENFEGMSVYDFSDEAKRQARTEIEWFIDAAGDIIERANISNNGIADDLWLTRNGHGTGFWDRGYDKYDADELSYLSGILGECWIYLGDDNKIYFESSDSYKKFDVQKYKEERKLKGDIKKYNL